MSGNGVDIAAVYQLLREVANPVIATTTGSPASEMAALRDDVDGLRKEVRSDIASLRQTLTSTMPRCSATASSSANWSVACFASRTT